MLNSKIKEKPIIWKAVLAGMIAAVLLTGLLVVPALAGNAKGKSEGLDYGYRPGWGWGDKNHTHTGPAGQNDQDDTEDESADDSEYEPEGE